MSRLYSSVCTTIGDALDTIAAACDSYERADDPVPTTPAIEKFIEKTNAEVGMHPNIK